MTVTQVVGRGYERGPTICYRGAISEVAFVPHFKLETIVANSEEDAVVDAIFQNAHTGKVGDGRIIVSDVGSVVRIRTDEADDTDADFVQHRNGAHTLPAAKAEVPASLFACSP
jgi:nitrogen regulatory protein PII